MRDKRRIKPYCDALASIWQVAPDLRLSQLMMDTISAYTNEHGTDPYYVEDEDFILYVYEVIRKMKSHE